MTDRRTVRSPYMEYAKLESSAKYNLATSGVAGYPLAQLPVHLEDLEINGPSLYGYAPLQERLAKKTGAPPECIVAAGGGTSLANHLAIAATLAPGDEVLIEDPTYELLITTARYLGAEVRSFPRRFEDDYRIEPAEVRKRVTARTRLIVVTNLHNPSSALADDATLVALAEIAADANAYLLVDEVYLEAVLDRPTSFHLAPRIIVTSSLTKGYGLSGLRCGWVLAEPQLAERMWRIHDLYSGIPAHPAELLSVVALDSLDRVGARARSILDANRTALNSFLDSRRDLACFRPGVGTTVFPRLLKGTVEALGKLLRKKYDASIVPGRFFNAPQHFRIGIGGDPEMTAEGLTRLGRALGELNG